MPQPRRHLYDQVAVIVARHIEDGVLGPGERLPSVRRLSAQHGVSISTAVRAYVTLENRGLIEARPQSGFYVRPRWRERVAEMATSRPRAGAARVSLGELRARLTQHAGDPNIISLGRAEPGAELLPIARLNRTLAAAVRRSGAGAVTYSPTTGCESLRRQLARQALDWGCQLAPEDFIVTNGAMEALFLCLLATTRPGDVVALESPTYFGLLEAVETLGLRALEVPTHPRDGMDLDRLEVVLCRERVAAVLTVPSFNNPLGCCMPPENRRRLVELLARREIPLIEDDLYSDLPHEPLARPHAVKSLDRKDLVLLCGSVSKTLAPGWRVGWVVPGARYYDRIKQLKASSNVSTGTAPQLALADFLREGGYARHLRSLRRAFANQVARMAQAVEEAFPSGIRLSRPQGGFVLWVELPAGVDALELHARAFATGIAVAPGPMFSARGRQYANFVRLSCGAPWSARTEQAIGVLGHLVRQLARADCLSLPKSMLPAA